MNLSPAFEEGFGLRTGRLFQGLSVPLSMSLESFFDKDIEALLEYENLTLSQEAYDAVPGRSYIKAVFQEHLGHLVPDAKLAKAIRSYSLAFLTKNEVHIQFFGSPLLGVYPVRFTDDDRLAWFDDVLDCDEITLTNDLHNCPTINPDFIVASDSFNQTIVFLLHLVHHSTKMNQKEIEQVKVDLISILHYKFISSIMAKYFKYDAAKEVALATYASLSKKYDLKVYGSWSALIRARAESIVARTGLHYNTYVRYDNDKAIQYMITDIQSRIREVIKAMTAEFYAVRDRNGRIGTNTATMDLDGTKVIKDRANAFLSFRRYIGGVMNDPASFIREELVGVVSNAMSGVPNHHIKEALLYLAEHSTDAKTKYLSDLVDETLIHAFDYIQRKGILINDLQLILAKLKAIYTASRSSDPSVLKLRELSGKLVQDTVKSKNEQVKAGVRTAVLLYILLRTLTMNHYK